MRDRERDDLPQERRGTWRPTLTRLSTNKESLRPEDMCFVNTKTRRQERPQALHSLAVAARTRKQPSSIPTDGSKVRWRPSGRRLLDPAAVEHAVAKT